MSKSSEVPKRNSVKSLALRFAESISNGVCSACNGYYGPAHGQSVCATCHAFLYANDLDLEVNVQLASVEREDNSDSDHDSGNFERFIFDQSILVCWMSILLYFGIFQVTFVHLKMQF